MMNGGLFTIAAAGAMLGSLAGYAPSLPEGGGTLYGRHGPLRFRGGSGQRKRRQKHTRRMRVRRLRRRHAA